MIDKLAKDIMVPLEEYPCIPKMVDQNVSLLPVLGASRVVGVVRSVDVLSEIALILNS